jgi:hypothetical protein
MATENGEDLNRLESLKSRLWSRNYKTKIEFYDTFPHKKEFEVKDNWEPQVEEHKISMKNSVFKKFFVFSVVFFLLAILYVGYNFFSGNNKVSNENIDIAILGNTFTDGGKPLPIVVEVTNRNSSALELVDLVAEYPKGSSGTALDIKERQRVSIGTIPSGGVHSENISVTLFGEQGSIQPVKISVEYRFKDSNAILVKEKNYEVTISATPINLLVDAPSEITPNQDITFKVRTSLNTTESATKNIAVKIDYPIGFEFTSASPSPDIGNNVWELSDMKPGDEKSITMVGKFVDVFDGEEKTFKVWSGAQSPSEKSEIGVVYNSQAHTLKIKKPFIDAQLLVNGEYARDYAITSQNVVAGEIRWSNNLSTKINDLEIKATLSGNAVNRKTIASRDGFYNSLVDTIVWDKNSNDKFASIDPGENGSVSFSFKVNPLLSAEGIMKSPQAVINVSISGKQALEGNALKKLENSETKIVRVVSDATFSPKIVHYNSVIQNSGPIPPKAEQETTYTVLWTITNSSNNLRNIKVRTTLPTWVKYTGSIYPAQEDITYNSASREVIWNAGTISRGTGMEGNPPREVAFQISFTPSLVQVEEVPILVNDAVLTGHDDFANVDVQINRASLNTNIGNPADPNAASATGRVVE